MISISGAVSVVLYLVIGGLIFWLLQFILDRVDPPEPYKKVANIILLILAVMVIIGILLSMINGQPLFRP